MSAMNDHMQPHGKCIYQQCDHGGYSFISGFNAAIYHGVIWSVLQYPQIAHHTKVVVEKRSLGVRYDVVLQSFSTEKKNTTT